MIAAVPSPCARALWIYGLASTSIMLARVRRAIYAICGKASASTGSTSGAAPLLPLQPAGNQLSLTANSSTSTGAITNTGMEMPVIDAAMSRRSVLVLRRSAAQVPAAIPTTSANSIASPPMRREYGNAAAISSETLCSRYRYEGPKSPRTTPPR